MTVNTLDWDSAMVLTGKYQRDHRFDISPTISDHTRGIPQSKKTNEEKSKRQKRKEKVQVPGKRGTPQGETQSVIKVKHGSKSSSNSET